MKKLMLIVAGALFMGGVALYAQDDTRTNESKKKTDQTTTPADQTRTMDQTNTPSESMKAGHDKDMKGWTKVNSADIPASLRTTLSGSQYRGWEKSSIYVNQAGDRYSLRLGDASSPKSYYFDKSGKPVEGMSNSHENMTK